MFGFGTRRKKLWGPSDSTETLGCRHTSERERESERERWREEGEGRDTARGDTARQHTREI